MLTVTSPWPVGVTVNVYVVPEPLKLPPVTAPLVIEISVLIKPVTDSLNVAVTGIGDTLVGLGDIEDNVTVGEVVSITIFLLALSELVAPGLGRVRAALFPAESLIVAVPGKVSDVVAT
jgi:hypothetical protein